MERSPGVPIERLLAQREWVRALARTLVRDEAGADDLEQQAWVEAIERPPRHGSGLRGWFATILRRRARDLWRDGERRDRREREAARPEAGRSTADLVAEAEAQRRVVEVLLALEEPYREVLLLRFHEDLPPSAIALRQGVSRETVKTRLRRALALLRERTGGRNGCLALLPLGGPRKGPTGIGGILVKASTRVAVAAGALAALGVSWWLAGASPPPPPGGAAAAGASPDHPVANARPALPAPPPEEPAAPAAVPVPDSPAAAGVARDRLPIVVAVEPVPPVGDRVEVEVDGRGRVTVGGRAMGMAALLAHLKERADAGREEENPKASLLNAVLRVDRDLPWQGAQWLMQACADPSIRICRIHFAAIPDSGGEEGVLPAFLPKDSGGPPERMDPGIVEEGGEARAEPDRRRVVDPPPVITVRLSRNGTGTPAAPRDLYPYLDRRFPDLRVSGFKGYIDAPPSVPSADVLAVMDAMLRAGMKSVDFKGTRAFKGDSLESALAAVPRPEGVLEITVLGESIAPR